MRCCENIWGKFNDARNSRSPTAERRQGVRVRYENDLARFPLLATLSVSGVWNVGVRDRGDLDGAGVSVRDQRRSGRRHQAASSGEIDPVGRARSAGGAGPKRTELGATHPKQHLRTKSDFRSSERSLLAHPIVAAAVVR